MKREDQVEFQIIHARVTFGGPWPGEWSTVATFKKIKDVRNYLVEKGVVKKFGGYQTEPDQMGCYDWYKVEVFFNFEDKTK